MIMYKRILGMVSAVIMAVVGLSLSLFLLNRPLPVQAIRVVTTRYVATTGDDGGGSNDCASQATPCHSVQHAVDQSEPGDEILVARGIYSGVQARAGMTQVVYISQTVILRGGYTTGDWDTSDPEARPTTLDAEGQGRVIAIVGDITPTLEGFIVTHGNATGQTIGCPILYPDGCGGGIFAYQSHPIIVNNVITNNVAAVTTAGLPAGDTGFGGGLHLEYTARAVISGNLVISNAGSLAAKGKGGGINLNGPYDVQVSFNQVLSNAATAVDFRHGWGGGIAVQGGSAAVQGNDIEGNWATGAGNPIYGQGAGLYQWYGSHDFIDNRVVNNFGNHAVYLGYSQSRFASNQVVDNATSIGIHLFNNNAGGLTLTNNIVAGSGDTSLSARGYVDWPLTATLLHNTLVGSGTEYGVSVETNYVTLFLTNNIVSGHAWGISNTYTASTVMADHTLFWANEQDGLRGTNPIEGDPDFIDPGSGNYHLGPNSAAIDAGANAGVTVDIEGDQRPRGLLPDIGADEAWWKQFFLPLIFRK